MSHNTNPVTAARWLDPAATAAYVGKPPGQLKRLVRAGLLPRPTYHFGPRSPRYDRDAIDCLIEGRTRRNTADEMIAEAINGILQDGQKNTRGRHR